MAKPKSIKDLLKNSQSEILQNISKSAKYVKHDFQDLGYRIALKLNDLSHRSLYMRLSKTVPEPTLTKALSFALDYPLKYGNNRAKIFMWKLKEIRSLEREEDEQIILVNEKDEEIGTKRRADLTHDDIYRVSSLWILNPKKELLLAKRSLRKASFPGRWGPAVTGTNAFGETYLTNIIKEAKEEIGLSIKSPIELSKRLVDANSRRYFVQKFMITTSKDISTFKLDQSEVSELKWFSREKLSQLNSDDPSTFIPGFSGNLENILKEIFKDQDSRISLI